MSLRDELYQAVLDHPDRDSPRRHYAEYLENQGDELGEYIRLSLQKTRHGLDRDKNARMLELHNKLRQEQTAPLAPWIRSHQRDRGLVALVEMDGQSFIEHGSEVFARAPIQHLDLRNTKQVFAEVVRNPVLSRVQTLSIEQNNLDDHEAALLASCPHVHRLVYLGLDGNCIGQRGFEALTASPFLTALRVLHLDYNLIESPVSKWSNDGVSGLEHYEGAGPTQALLKNKYGEKPWMNPPQNIDRFRMCDAGE